MTPTDAEWIEGFVFENFSVLIQVTFWSEIFRIMPHFGVLQHRVDIHRNNASLRI
jgi:hypothetical protein